MAQRPRTRIPVKTTSSYKENDDEDLLSLSNTTSTSFNEHVNYFPGGQNWRRMFDEEIACDITIDVDGEIIRAHKNVLMSRCQYFAAMFSGKSKDSISIMYLDGFSFKCVYFALCQIYSGCEDIPQDIDIFELADLADLLNMEGLKELVAHILEFDYFHGFHRPCKECTYLISKFLPWSGAAGYIDIYYKILLWIEKYCDEIWPKREFALLPYDVIKKCFLHHTLDIDTENVLEMVGRCERLMFTLPKVAWTANIFRFSLQLLRDCVRYISTHLADVLSTESFLILARNDKQSAVRLEDRMTAAIERANPLQVCAAYAQLHKLLRAPPDQNAPEWRELLTRLAIRCEDALICCASQAMSTSAWLSLQPDLQARIRTYSGIINTSTYTKYLQNANKYTRERNVERIKYILYSQLGNINRVPVTGSRQHLPAPTASKRFFVAPGNSMVSSTKVTKITSARSSQSIVPANHNQQYKDVKPRYLNPKPARSEQLNSSVKKQMPNKNVPVNNKSSPRLNNPTNKKICNRPNSASTKENAMTTKRTNPKSHVNVLNNYNSNNKIFGSKSNSSSDPTLPNQRKSSAKSLPTSYVSPYSFRPFDTTKYPKSASNMTNGKTKYNKDAIKTSLTSNDRSKIITDMMSANKRNISVSDTALSVGSVSLKDSQTALNKSSAFKKSSFDQSNILNSPSQRMSSSFDVHPTIEIENHKASNGRLIKDAKLKNIKPKEYNFAKSTMSSSAKINKKTVNDYAIGDKNSFTSNDDSIIINDDEISSSMTRSRTFLKKEPSVISKDIILDSSIEMYPK